MQPIVWKGLSFAGQAANAFQIKQLDTLKTMMRSLPHKKVAPALRGPSHYCPNSQTWKKKRAYSK
jgi:hypothetical protein